MNNLVIEPKIELMTPQNYNSNEMNEEVVGIHKTPLVYSRRKRENVVNLISLPYCQFPSLEKGIIFNPSTPSNSLIKSDLDIPIANRKGVITCTKYLLITIKPLPLPCYKKPSQKVYKKL